MKDRRTSHEPVEKANEYARRGIERFPDDWHLYFLIGFNYRVEWPTDSPEEKAKMREMATPYLRVAAALPGSELDPNYIAKLMTDQNEEELALLHIGMGYWKASEEERRSLRGYMISLGERASAEHVRRIEESWLEEFPYMQPTLFELLGERGDTIETSWAHLGLAEDQGGAP